MRTIEIIKPPPEMRRMLNKTARFIAEKGSKFKRNIMSSNAKNLIFNFMRRSDPCHAFYQQNIVEYHVRIQDEADLDASGDEA